MPTAKAGTSPGFWVRCLTPLKHNSPAFSRLGPGWAMLHKHHWRCIIFLGWDWNMSMIFFVFHVDTIYQTHRSYGIGDPFWEIFRFSCCLFWAAKVFRVFVVLLFTAPASCLIVARSNLFDSMGHSVPSFFGRQLCQWPYLEGPESRVRCGSH